MQLTADDAYKIRQVYRHSLTEMALLLDVSTSLICKIEKGQRNLTPRIQRRLIEEFQLSPKKLVRILEIYEGEI